MKIYKIMTTMFLLAVGISSCGKTPENSSPSVENSEDTPSESQDVIQEEYTEGLSFTLLGNGTYYGVSIGTATDKDIVIPGSYNNLPVKKVLSYGFCDGFIESVTINEGVSIIEDDAFYYCNSLKTISLPNSLIYIGDLHMIGRSVEYNEYEEGLYLGNKDNPYLYFMKQTDYKEKFVYHKDCKFINIFNPAISQEVVLPDEIRMINSDYFSQFIQSPDYLKFNEYANGLYLGNENNPYVMLVKAKDIDAKVFGIHKDCKWLCEGWSSYGVLSMELESLIVPNGITTLKAYAARAKNVVLPEGLKVLDVRYSVDDYYIPESVELLINNSAGFGTPFSNYVDNKKDLKELSINEYENCYYIGSKENPYKYCVYADNNVKSIKLHDDTQEVFDYAFASLPLESVTLNDKLEVIGENAFYMCPSLKTINFPDSLRVIKDQAFDRCPLLDNVVLPNNLYSIGFNNFGNISDKKSIKYSDSLKVLGNGNPLYNLPKEISVIGVVNAYRYSQGVVNTSVYDEEIITLPNNIRYMGIATFEGCENLKSIKIPDRVTVLENYLFKDCKSLKEVDMNNVNVVNNYVFGGCSSLDQITLPENTTSIGYQMFSGCESLKEIKIPESVTSIENNAFANCSSLVNIVLPNNVNSIGNSAFEGCVSLTSIKIPENVEKIGDKAFSGCSSLEYIAIPSKVEAIQLEQFKNCTSLKEILIPEGVKYIASKAFENCAIEKLHIPSTVEGIGNNAFYMCNLLKEIKVDENNKVYDSRDNCNAIIETATNKLIKGCENTIVPESVEIIGEYAFAFIENIKEINLSEGLTTIEKCAFVASDLEVITLPSSLSVCGEDIFLDSKLKEVSCYANGTLERLFKKVNTIEQVTLLGGQHIANEMFSDCGNIKEIVIPSSVLIIGDKAFNSCDNLSNVIIGENVTTIQARAFNYCKKLKEIVLPKSIQEIGNQVFYKLEKLYYEGSLEEFNAINISDKNDVLIKLIEEDKIVYSYVKE